jgi:hypothetical protein
MFQITARAFCTLRKVIHLGFMTLQITQREGCGQTGMAIVRLNGVENNIKYGLEIGHHSGCGGIGIHVSFHF